MSILSDSPETDIHKSKDKIRDVSVDIANEFKRFVDDIESMVKETASLTGDDLARAKIRIIQRINAAKQRVNFLSDTMLDQARKTAARTNEYAHEEPWAVIGTSAFVSFVLGLLLGRHNENSRK